MRQSHNEGLSQYRQTRPARECGLGFAQDRLWKDFDHQTMLRFRPQSKRWELWYIAPRSGPYCIHTFDWNEQSADLVNAKAACILRRREAASNHLKEMFELSRKSEIETADKKRDLSGCISDFSKKRAKGTVAVTV
jgi:hypothetical protein